jgi:hypothetical protein
LPRVSDDEEDSECIRVSSPNDPQQMASASGPFANPLTHSWLIQDYGGTTAAAYFGRSGWPITHPIRPPFFTLQGFILNNVI